MSRIDRELAALPKPPRQSYRFLPVVAVSSPEQAFHVHKMEHDAVLLYACTGCGQALKACVSPLKDTLIFVRHRSGPVYYWYEALSSRYLSSGYGDMEKRATETGGRVHVDDVVVDDYRELLTRLRGLSGARNLLGTRIVALGGPAGKYSPEAPEVARNKYKMDIVDVSYDDFGKRVRAGRGDARVVAAAEKCARRYLAMPGTTMSTKLPFVTNAFVLYRLFLELLREHDAQAFTVKSCMSTIIPMSETTACLTLSLMNDDGLMAYGDHLSAAGYAARKLGVRWVDIAKPAMSS